MDFGVGGNLGVADELQRTYPLHEFHSCDLYPFRKQGYFEMYSSASPFGTFDGISSNAVVEHLDNTLDAWRYLNRLLRPMSEGGGLMIHAFPSQLVEDPGHWAIRIESHECLFSKESLNLVCEKSGFDFAKMRYFSKVQHPVYYFRKTRDCS